MSPSVDNSRVVYEAEDLPDASRVLGWGRLHQLDQHAAGVFGVHEADPGTGGASARRVVEQPQAGARSMPSRTPVRRLPGECQAFGGEGFDGAG